jgi:hypothetical protein
MIIMSPEAMGEVKLDRTIEHVEVPQLEYAWSVWTRAGLAAWTAGTVAKDANAENTSRARAKKRGRRAFKIPASRQLSSR